MKWFIGEESNLKAKNAILVIVVTILCATVVITKFLDFKAKKYVQTIILPPIVSEKMVITAEDANDGYFKDWVKFVADRGLNYTPANYNDQFNDFMETCASDYYEEIRKKFQALGSKIDKTNITSAFWLDGPIKINRAEKTIKFQGRRKKWAEGYDISDKEEFYVINYRIENAKFEIITFNEVDKG